MSANPAPQSADASPQGTRAFSERTLVAQLRRDALLRWGSFALLLVGFFAAMTLDDDGFTAGMLGALIVLGLWLAMNVISARVSREIPRISALIESDPAAAEAQLAQALQRRPLVRWVRLMLYQRLAALRHRQRRLGESAAICRALLRHGVGRGRAARAQVLLMLAEAALEHRDLTQAYFCLIELHRTRLSLVEALQRLALQTRYEVAARHHHAALHAVNQKVQLAEIMPPPQCVAMHAMLATAAAAAGRPELHRWLDDRVQLLADPDMLKDLVARGLYAATT